MSNDQPLIRVSDLERRFGDTRAVAGISFDLRPGDVLGFLGPNGAGKSTTMRMLTGNLAPTGGAVAIQGIDLLDNPREAKARIGYLPEYPPVYRELTVDEHLHYCARLRGIRRRDAAAAVRAARSRTGLETMGGRLIGNLSRGYQQRVGLAQAIIHRPEVIVLDEPTIGLDPIQVREIRDLIRDLGDEHGVILSTHILPEVQAVCNRVQIINEGELVFSEEMEGMHRRLAPTALRLELAQPPAGEDLVEVPGVEEVQPLDEGSFRIHHAAGASPAEALAEAAVNRGWGLRALVPEEASLEQIFVDLTLKETGAAGEQREAA